MEYTSRIENDEYELLIRCSDYKKFKSFERLMRNGLTKIDNQKIEKEIPKHENDINLDIPVFTTLESGNANNFGMMWFFILIMVFLCSGNHDSYYKGMCDAYEKIFTPNKQEENIQKARDSFAELIKSVENLTKGEAK